MSQHTPNELTRIFARDRELVTRLKTEDAHYARLADEYHEVNREVHRIEAETEAASDERFETLKKQRLALLDEITAIIAKARAEASFPRPARKQFLHHTWLDSAFKTGI